MTIKQLGGVFGRNPTFNNVTIEGTLTFDGDIDINSDLTIEDNLYVLGSVGIRTSSPIAALDVTGKDAAGSLTSLADTVTRAAAIVRGSTHANGYGLYMGYGNTSTDAQYIQSTKANGATAFPLLLNPYGGSVGIGTSSPTLASGWGRVLHVQSASSGSMIRLADASSGTSGEVGFMAGQYGGSTYLINRDSGNMYFYTDGTERMQIDASGNLLVGGTSVGDSDSCAIESYGAITIARASGVGRIHMTFTNGGATVGTISTTGSATAYNTSSDQRLKENIADADNAGSKIDAIQVRKFDWKADGSHQDYGMVAQELLEVAPEAVSAPEDPEEMMGVDYSKLVPMMLKEIQSLRARVAQLES